MDTEYEEIIEYQEYSQKEKLKSKWARLESVQAKMKMTIKRFLKKYGYPPDKMAKAVDIVMEQTKLMCQNESR
ncbi:MAG TPA: DUF3387 domain-containing protein [Bacillota bacterium]|nr:DUF3387 domain-containing protein [Bacillota bacterium]HPX69338.1 DUF3387 domain-containing protein [Bacillota bacterium]HQA65696.1 DUF3387 domain-containing protein [Bacillota bacterium]HQO42586.1 DUF3387 domain-containing protein [Bacillota bacterium]